MVKVKLIKDFYIWAIVLINQYEEIVEILFFSLIGEGGGPNSALMHVALCKGNKLKKKTIFFC